MDKLYEDITAKKFTNVEIILVDSNDTLILNLHKCILACSSTYFNNLFNFGIEKNSSSIKIEVGDAKIAHDLILSFYNQKINSTMYSDTKYLLEMFKCRSYFCLDNDVTLLYNIKIPTEEFELLIHLGFDNADFALQKLHIDPNVSTSFIYNAVHCK